MGEMTRQKTIMTQIQLVENVLKESMYRVDVLQKRLDSKLLTTESREQLEAELEEVKKVLKRNADEIQNLRKQNTKSFMVVASLVFACFLLYGLYLMLYDKI
ncbi:uncharacterized protein LOC143342512 isoform X1 [Colletes latitarsis]|uniref:uncharacterized protein LOC122394970 n=1 Tax=Colletes gigas TaxID=935657 RepID=UPI001C9B0149|nr:uncharacterized protein LOC122394970 [Colletes gigas]